jgi:hypothetical protein
MPSVRTLQRLAQHCHALPVCNLYMFQYSWHFFERQCFHMSALLSQLEMLPSVQLLALLTGRICVATACAACASACKLVVVLLGPGVHLGPCWCHLPTIPAPGSLRLFRSIFCGRVLSRWQLNACPTVSPAIRASTWPACECSSSHHLRQHLACL